MLEALIAQQTRQQTEIAALTRQLLDDGHVDPGELMSLHQRARATGLAVAPTHA